MANAKQAYKKLRTFTVEGQKVSIFKDKESRDAKKDVTRTMRIDFDSVESVPVELCTPKVSQSNNPEKRGKIVFRWLTMSKVDGDKRTSTNVINWSKAEEGTDPSILKKWLAKYVESNPELQISAYVPLKGKFLNVDLSDNLYIIFNDDEYPGEVNPSTGKNDTLGQPPYFLKDGTPLNIELTEMINVKYPEHSFMQVYVSNYDLEGKDVFTERRRPTAFKGKDANPFAEEVSGQDKYIDDLDDFEIDDEL